MKSALLKVWQLVKTWFWLIAFLLYLLVSAVPAFIVCTSKFMRGRLPWHRKTRDNLD